MNFLSHVSEIFAKCYGKPTEEITTKMNPEGRSSQGLTMHNWDFDSDYRKAQAFEEAIFASYKREELSSGPQL